MSRDRMHPLAGWLTGLLVVGTLAGVVLGLPRLAPEVRGPDGTPVDAVEVPEPVTCEDLPSETGPAPEAPRPAGRVTSTALVGCPDRFDGRTVTYVGEIVGDVLERDDGAWVLMNDDAYALEVGPLGTHGQFRGGNAGVSVWLDGGLARLADEPGRAGRRGDILRVQGVAHRADPADGGGLTIRASDARVVADARQVSTPVHVPQAVVAGVLALLAVGVAVAQHLADRRR